jgi:hypothetical protein
MPPTVVQAQVQWLDLSNLELQKARVTAEVAAEVLAWAPCLQQKQKLNKLALEWQIAD